jgi:hypothetical protein
MNEKISTIIMSNLKCSYIKKNYNHSIELWCVRQLIKFFILVITLLVFQTNIFAQLTINYGYDGSNIANPERGFYKYSSYPGSLGDLNSYRSQGYTLLYRIYYLDKNSSSLSSFIPTFESEMQSLRNAGMKCVLRFAYTSSDANDAPVSTVLSHLDQLKNSLQKYYDVIAVLQAGFIGEWGEWYYTNNFGNQGNISSGDWTNRTNVLMKELSIMPQDRMIAIRYPWQKKIMLGRSNTITDAEAYNGSNWSRVGFHDDAFMAASDDWGTFPNGQSDRDFLAAESKYLSTGGEAESGDQSLNGCSNTNNQISYLHMSYLDLDYNTNTINKWISEGCYNDIQKRMGYRFYLRSGTYTNQVQPGGTFNLNINLTNEGYAAPFNPRLVEVVLKNKSDGKVCKVKLNVDPRKWLPGQFNINQSIGIPGNYPAGTYRVYLNLADPTSTLYGNPAYSIRLGNTNMWDGSTGYNDLGFDLAVSNNSSTTAYSGTQWFDACYGNNIAPSVSITSPLNNSAFVSGSNIVFKVNASDPDGSISKVEFYNGSTLLGSSSTSPYSFTWNGVAQGVYTITAKAYDNAGAIANSSPITITVNPQGNNPPVVTITSPSRGQNFTPGSNITLTASAIDDGSIARVEFFSGTTKIGESSASPYSIVWSSVPQGNYSLTAKATDNLGATTVSSPVNITVSVMVMCSATGNILWEIWNNQSTGKQVSLVNWSAAPSASKLLTSFEGPTNYADEYGSRIRGYICPPVSGDYVFYIASDDNSELWLSTDNDPANKVKIAYVSDWTNSREWTKLPEQKSAVITLTANRKYYVEALHKEDLWGDNLAVGWTIPGSSSIDVIPGANLSPFTSNQPPSVSITSPSNNSSFSTPASITINASASDADGTISKVDFYNGTMLLGSDASSPYSFSWNNVTAGSYTITAKATDNSGAVTTSASIAIVVVNSSSNQAPTVSITSPTNNSSYTVPASITINATASDADGTVSKVDFYNGSSLLGSDASSPYSFSWSNVAAGTYSITAKATDNAGAVTTSTSVAVTVTAVNTSTDDLISASCVLDPNAPFLVELNSTKLSTATSFNWWVNASNLSITQVAGQSWKANIVFGPYFTGGQVCVGVNYNGSPWYASYCKNVSLCPSAIVSPDQLLVYPNPAIDRLKIDSGSDLTGATIVVVDAYGNIVHPTISITQSSATFDLTSLSQGLYFVTVQTTSGKLLKTSFNVIQ